jgi:hypothetical protein
MPKDDVFIYRSPWIKTYLQCGTCVELPLLRRAWSPWLLCKESAWSRVVDEMKLAHTAVPDWRLLVSVGIVTRGGRPSFPKYMLDSQAGLVAPTPQNAASLEA